MRTSVDVQWASKVSAEVQLHGAFSFVRIVATSQDGEFSTGLYLSRRGHGAAAQRLCDAINEAGVDLLPDHPATVDEEEDGA